MVNVAIFRTGGIGDVILSFCCIEFVRKYNIPIEIIWITKQPSYQLVRDAFPDIKCIEIYSKSSYSKNFKNIIKPISDLELIIDLQKSLRTILLSLLLKYKFGSKYHTWNKGSLRRSILKTRSFLRKRDSISSINSAKPEFSRYLLMLKCFHYALYKSQIIDSTFPLNHIFPTVRIPISNRFLTEFRGRIYIALNLGASHPGKEAPMGLFERIVQLLKESTKQKFDLILVGDAKSIDRSNSFTKKFNSEFLIHNCAGKYSLFQTASILKCCKIIVTNDGALSHLAESVGTPTATLFGSTVEAFGYQPFLSESRSFSTNLGCSPCTKDGVTNCRFNDKKCFTDININPIVSFVKSKIA